MSLPSSSSRFETGQPLHAEVAQLVEHHVAIVKAAGSRPVLRSKFRRRSWWLWADGCNPSCRRFKSFRRLQITNKGGGSDGAVEKLVRAIVVRYGLTVDEAKEVIAMTLVVFGNNMTLKELVGLLGKYKIKEKIDE